MSCSPTTCDTEPGRACSSGSEEEYGRRQAAAVAAQFDGGPVPADLFLLAPLTTRTVEAPGGEIVSVQMGLPLVATRAGGVTVAPDRLAIAALRLAANDA